MEQQIGRFDARTPDPDRVLLTEQQTCRIAAANGPIVFVEHDFTGIEGLPGQVTVG